MGMTKILDDQGRPVLHPYCKTCQARLCTQASKLTSLPQSVSTIREVVKTVLLEQCKAMVPENPRHTKPSNLQLVQF